jgi:hypothetical protein
MSRKIIVLSEFFMINDAVKMVSFVRLRRFKLLWMIHTQRND